MYYPRRLSNRAISGERAHHIGRTVTWEATDDMTTWAYHTAKIKCVGKGERYFVDEQGLLQWVDSSWQNVRSLVVVE